LRKHKKETLKIFFPTNCLEIEAPIVQANSAWMVVRDALSSVQNWLRASLASLIQLLTSRKWNLVWGQIQLIKDRYK
jgi:hypothetical protein